VTSAIIQVDDEGMNLFHIITEFFHQYSSSRRQPSRLFLSTRRLFGTSPATPVHSYTFSSRTFKHIHRILILSIYFSTCSILQSYCRHHEGPEQLTQSVFGGLPGCYFGNAPLSVAFTTL
jgi:hypothetical protein